MFDKLLNRVSLKISTIRAVIQINNRLREIMSGNETAAIPESEGNRQIMELVESVPKKLEWEEYEHCAAIMRLYAIYEGFVENLIKDWLKLVPNLVPRYLDLEERIQETHREGVGRLLIELKKRRFKELSSEEVVRGLCDGVTGNEKYELIPEAFLLHEQNLRKDVLNKLFADSGICQNTWNWVKEHRGVKKFFKVGDRTAEKELEQLVDYRNEAAHRFINDILGTQKLLGLCDFTESLCQALAELVTYQIISLQVSQGEAREVGQITEWFRKPKAAIAIVNNVSLSVGESLFLVSEASSYCRLAIIESIKVDDISQPKVEIATETEVGLKFDIDARKGLKIYLLVD